MAGAKGAAAAAAKVASVAVQSANVAVQSANVAIQSAKEASDIVAKSKKQNLSGFHQVLPISQVLKKFFGVSEISRVDTMKRFWTYVKEKELQNPEKKREIICDEQLKLVLGKDKVDFLEVSGLLNSHFPKKESKRK